MTTINYQLSTIQMSRTYKATGIILKGMPLGEADRLVTILTPEFGLIRAVVPGARKYTSKFRGRTELLVVNELLIARGRSLDKITQAETLTSYAGLSRDLGKLTASQYLAELVLGIALSEQPQPELYELLKEHLRRLEQLSPADNLCAHLSQAVFHLLAIAGIAPQVQRCCLSQKSIYANFSDPYWRIGFNFDVGGLVLENQVLEKHEDERESKTNKPMIPKPGMMEKTDHVNRQLGAVELTLLQQLGAKTLTPSEQLFPTVTLTPSVEVAWIRIERLLRDYVQYQLGRSLRSATFIDTLPPLDF